MRGGLKMPLKMFLGCQRGDEGKGKLVDLELSSGAFSWNVRFQGGRNAGHTVLVGDQQVILHLIPSGVHHENVQLGLGQGVIFDPEGFFEEVDKLKGLEIEVEGRLTVSPAAKLVMPWDKVLDGAFDHVRAEAQGKAVEAGGGVYTTNRGIGPAYANATARDGLTVAHLLNENVLKQRLGNVVPVINRILVAFDCPETSVDEVFDLYAPLGERLHPFVGPLHEKLVRSLGKGEWTLIEGGQGRFLSIDCAISYPCCTSSITTSNAAFAGLGIPLRKEWLGPIVGVVKAYQSAVGNHPMPTLIGGDREENLRQRGKEFGATTGRPRHCCWINALELAEGVLTNGCTEIAITKLDVLDAEPDIPIVRELCLDGEAIHGLPLTHEVYLKCKAEYGDPFPGWETDITKIRRRADLPNNADGYLRQMEAIAEVPISGVSNGPEREQFIVP
jgi:adenylosuccinate synthase